MPILLSIKDARKAYGDRALLDGASVAITDGQRVGLIGRNGCGKSTLCRALIGDEALDSGDIAFHPGTRLGYLRQHDPWTPEDTVLGFLLRESGQPDWRCGQVAGRFEIKGPMLERRIAALSGGWQTRVKLCALLLEEPNFLVLDEPTNFLDLRTQLLLESFLKGFGGAALVVSHDRTFLNETCTHTLELARGALTLYPGSVDGYLARKAERRGQIERENEATLAKRRQLERFIAKNRAGANTASQARSKKKQLERLELTDLDGPDGAQPRFRLPSVEPRSGPALRCEDLAIGYGSKKVCDEIRLDVAHGERVAVVGQNGEGKTTFLRTVVGSLEPLAGQARWSGQCQIGCYAQHVYQALPASETVLGYLERTAATGTSPQRVRDVAGAFLFSGLDAEKRIGMLSGGERARACMAGLLLGPYNVLLLDEPGNHLDVESVEALAEACLEYRGTIVFTSHDRHFLHRVASHVIEVKDGRVASYPADYDTYLHRVAREVSDGLRDDSDRAAAATVGPGGDAEEVSRADRKAEARRLHKLRKQTQALERKLERLEAERQALNERLLTVTEREPAERLGAELRALAVEISGVEAEWLELTEQIA